MATLFGRPVGNLYANIAKAAGIGGLLGALKGYHDAKKEGDENPYTRALETGAAWAVSDAVVEAGLGLVAPGIREGGLIKSTLVSSAVGGVTGYLEAYGAAKVNHEEDANRQGLINAGEWAAIDGGLQLVQGGILPYLRALKA